MPPHLLQIDPVTDCAEESRPFVADLNGILAADPGGHDFLVLDWNPDFKIIDDPRIRLKTGIAILKEKQDHRYIFDLGRLPALNEFALLILETPGIQTDDSGPANPNRFETFILERINGSDCIRFQPK